ncbi:MAG: HAMP domain-containing histidine kinase [Xanthomonadaceae bacterium]|nr:HAMP domain-containing histidine kinase [Xanthomonadaceae bacterium]
MFIRYLLSHGASPPCSVAAISGRVASAMPETREPDPPLRIRCGSASADDSAGPGAISAEATAAACACDDREAAARAAERSLRPAVASPVRPNRNKVELLAIVAHELRAPLHPLRLAAAYLRQSLRGGLEAQLSAIAVIERQAAHLDRLIGDLLDSSRLSLDKMTLQLDDVRLSAAIAAAVDASQALADRKRVSIRTLLPHDDIRVRADALRLVQIFTNLIHNAIKFSLDGGSVDVRIAPDWSGRFVVVAVRDYGVGIAADFIDSVFDLFAQSAEQSSHGGGLGIGLSIVHKLTHMHGGTVAVRSDGAGLGSEFRVTLPLSCMPASAAVAAASNLVAAAPSSSL